MDILSFCHKNPFHGNLNEFQLQDFIPKCLKYTNRALVDSKNKKGSCRDEKTNGGRNLGHLP